MAENDDQPKKGTTNPMAKEAYTKAGNLFEDNKFEEAIELYSQAIKEDPAYASAYFNRALAYAIINKYDEATADAKSVMGIEPDSYDAPYVMGIIAEYKKDYEGARDWYQKAIAKNPKYEQAKARLEQLKTKIERPAGMEEQGGKAKVGVDSNATEMQEGQIKKVKWYKSSLTFKDIVGMKKQKELIHQNIILAIRKPELLKAYGKRLGLGVLFYGPPGCGKCVTENTRVLLPDGRYLQIKEVVENKEPYVLTLTEKHKLAVRKVSGWWKLEGKPLLRIKTSRGRVIECTPEHPFLVRGGWKEASSLSVGDEIGVPRHVPVFGNAVMKESEIKLLAYLISEGGLTQGSPKFTNSDQEILEDFKSSVMQFDHKLHINTQVSSGNVANLQVAGRYIKEHGPQGRSSLQLFLDTYGLSFTSSYTKKIPQVVFSLQKRFIALFLNRLFSGDGWFEDREEPGVRYGTKRHRIIGYSSNSRELVGQVQHLLLRFGILSSIREKGNGNFEVVVYRSRDIDIFIDEIGMFGKKASILFKKKESWSKVKKKGGNRVVYEEIEKIEQIPAPEHVYDLTVEDTHNFVANDFFVHNTYFVNAIAGETKSNVIIAAINEIVDMYAGNTEKNMHAIFEQARKNTPCVVFFDEVDALGMKRGDGGGGGDGGGQSYMRMAVNQFLQEMDGIEKNPEGIFIIGATNQPWDMDPALKRSGRFGESIYIPPPDYRTRKQSFIYNTRKMPLGRMNFGRLSRATMGFSQADIAGICDKAALVAAAEEDRTGKRRKIRMADFLGMIKQHGNTLDEWYGMVRKDIVSKTETQIVDGKKQEIVKEGKLSPEEKVRYKALVKDVKKNSSQWMKMIKKFMRSFSI
ncbi:MAG: AAA family ATPase, partial [Candidatus Micrarchaeota archaeon]|nr:AAA family ATPase [Candidatus Micrarchaeota archaeon]